MKGMSLLLAAALLASSGYVIFAEEFFIGFMAAMTDKQTGEHGIGYPTASVFAPYMFAFSDEAHKIPALDSIDHGRFRGIGK